MLADNILGWEIVLKISYLPTKLRFSAKYSFFGQSLSRGHYQPTYQPPEGVYLLNNPSESEGLIRQLYHQISALDEIKVKELLLAELKAKASQGLQGDLKEMPDRKGLQLDGLILVLNNLTSVCRLAKFLYDNQRTPKEVEKVGLKNVSIILRSDLEVLGALTAEEIYVSKEWVKKICSQVPSLLALSRLREDVLKDCCQGAEIAEMNVVYRLIGTTHIFPSEKTEPTTWNLQHRHRSSWIIQTWAGNYHKSQLREGPLWYL